MWDFNLYGLMNLSNFIFMIFLFGLLLFKNRHDTRVISFSLFILFGALWALFLFLWQTIPTMELATLSFRIAMAFAILVVSAIFHFIYIILGIDKEKRVTLYSIHALNLIFTYLEVSNFFYLGFEERFGFGLWPIVNNYFHLFISWWMFQVIYMLYLVFSLGVRKKTGREKVTNKQLMLALCVGFGGGSTNWFLWYNIPFPPYLVCGTSIMVIWIGYIVFRHQLFDIEIIIKRTALFAGLFFLASIIVFTISSLISPLFLEVGVSDIFSTILSFAIFIALFRPTEVYLEHATNRWLFQRKINYENLLHSLGDTLKKISALDPLCETLKKIMTDFMQLKYFLIYVFDSNEDCYHLNTLTNTEEEFPNVYDMKDSIVRFISANDNILAYDFVTNLYLKQRLLQMKAKVLIPLKSANRLIGFAIVGDKLSDKVFDNIDLRAFRSMQASVATAIDNALTFEKLTQSQVELAQKEKLATIGVLAAGIKHEINNPLFVILGRTEMLLRNTNLKEWEKQKVIDYVQRQATSIKYNADRIKDIVVRLSDFAKPIDKAEMSNVNVSQLINDSIQLLGYDEEDLSHVDFNIEIDENLEVSADSRMLVQIFFNLINNAIHAINFDGSLTISSLISRRVQIIFRDNGEGIDEKNLQKIFDPFFTTKDTTQGDENSIKGTGLGLHLVYNYVKKMNGNIKVDSTIGEGTSFTITLDKSTTSYR